MSHNGERKPTAVQKWVREQIAIKEGEHPAQLAAPPFESLPFKERAKQKLSPLMDARRKAQLLAGWYQDDVFDSWARKFLVVADDPRQWTQAQVLYESYVKAATLAEAGGARTNVGKTARETIATQTQWGRMMATKFTKKRRSRGWFYPVRIGREV